MLDLGLIILALTGKAAFLFVVIFIVLVTFPLVFYLLTLQRTLMEISFENRKIQPEQVWLSLIPLFGIVWQYFIVNRMAASLKLEFDKRNIYLKEQKPGYDIGIAYCILFSASILPYLGILSALGGLVCWVLYWLKINDYLEALRQNPLNFLSN